MWDVDAVLTALRGKAAGDAQIREKLLATQTDERPVRAFCELAASYGYPLGEMDLISAGEEYYANMRRSTNGGGENSPLLTGEDDYYELFMEELKRM